MDIFKLGKKVENNIMIAHILITKLNSFQYLLILFYLTFLTFFNLI